MCKDYGFTEINLIFHNLICTRKLFKKIFPWEKVNWKWYDNMIYLNQWEANNQQTGIRTNPEERWSGKKCYFKELESTPRDRKCSMSDRARSITWPHVPQSLMIGNGLSLIGRQYIMLLNSKVRFFRQQNGSTKTNSLKWALPRDCHDERFHSFNAW